MTEHELKVWPPYFDAIADGAKRFEFRDNDRDFKVGDVLVLRKWDPTKKAFAETGRVVCLVTYILAGPAFGLPDGKVILSLGEPL